LVLRVIVDMFSVGAIAPSKPHGCWQ